MSYLYKTNAINETSRPSTVRVDSGLELQMSSPLSSDEGSNPEELLGMAWATCLNMTAQALLKAKQENLESRVNVAVTLNSESSGVGFYFTAEATLSIESYSIESTEKLLRQAHDRCPVSKMIKDYAFCEVRASIYE